MNLSHFAVALKNCLPRVVVVSIRTVSKAFPVAVRDDRLLVRP